MALKMIVHRKRPAPSSRAKTKHAGGKTKQKQRRRYYKMPSEDYYFEFRFDDDIGDDMVEVNYELDFDSIDRYEMLEDFISPPSDDSDPAVAVAVAEARDRHTGERVSLKRVSPSEGDGGNGEASLSAVVREARCLQGCLGHPNILQLKGVAAADDETGDLFIVTERLLGSCTLRSLLTRRRLGFSEDETRALMRQLLTAAEAMHGAGVTHRDINPDTIVLVGGSGALKLTGFRCAITPAERFVGEPHPPMGTLRYCSPQQLNGLRCYCPAEDMWAIGCVMAELLAGEPLFAADTQEDLLDETVDLRDDLFEFGAEAEAFVDAALQEVSLAGRELLASLLAFETEDRPTAADALKHRWFAENDVVKAKSRVVRAYTKQ